MALGPTGAVEEAWRTYCATGRVQREALKIPIADSWERCCSLPFRPNDLRYRPPLAQPAELASLRAQYAPFLEIAMPFLQDLVTFVYGSGFLVVLTSASGHVLEVLGDPGALDQAHALNLVPGALWSEEAVGTSAIGLAIRHRLPVQVAGMEHYWQPFHTLTCSAAPICGKDGQLVAVLDLSGPTHLVHSHTLGMVVAAARAVERQMHLTKVMHELRTSHDQVDTLLGMVHDGAILVDMAGRVVKMNRVAATTLQWDPTAAVGQPVTALFGADPRIQQALAGGRGLQDEELALAVRGRPVHCLVTVHPLTQEGGSRGFVITLRETREVSRLAQRVRGEHARFTVDDILGISPAIQQVRKQVQAAALTDSTVLILGESGTGKELVAHAIHNASPRRKGPFIVLNCGAIPRNLLESELFGYEPGTFTGAHRQGRPGKFELADGGTIFLDEIGDMPLDMQTSLLRVLQTKEVTRLGGDRAIPVNVRVIAATNRDLYAEASKGNFRLDLLYRLDVLTIRIPPLRERPEDVPVLVAHLLARWEQSHKRRIAFTPAAMRALIAYPWPGNVRELENVVEKCIFLSDKVELDVADLPLASPGGSAPLSLPTVTAQTRADRQRQAFMEAWQACGGRATEVARLLGISRATAYRRAREYGLLRGRRAAATSS